MTISKKWSNRSAEPGETANYSMKSLIFESVDFGLAALWLVGSLKIVNVFPELSQSLLYTISKITLSRVF